MSKERQLFVIDSDFEIEFNSRFGRPFYYPWVDDPTFLNYNWMQDSLVEGDWNHLAVTWDRSTGDARICVNGSEQVLSTNNTPTTGPH